VVSWQRCGVSECVGLGFFAKVWGGGVSGLPHFRRGVVSEVAFGMRVAFCFVKFVTCWPSREKYVLGCGVILSLVDVVGVDCVGGVVWGEVFRPGVYGVSFRSRGLKGGKESAKV